MYSVSDTFKSLIRSGAEQNFLITFDDMYVMASQGDIEASGVEFCDYFNTDAEINIGDTPSNTFSVSLMNINGYLSSYQFGEGRPFIGVKTGTFSCSDASGQNAYAESVVGSTTYKFKGNSDGFYIDDTLQNATPVHIIWAKGKRVIVVTNNSLDEYQLDGTTWTRSTRSASTYLLSKPNGGYSFVDNILKVYKSDGTGEAWEYCPLGVFRFAEPTKRQSLVIELSAYDRMAMFDKDAAEFLAGNWVYPITLEGLFQSLCQYVGLESGEYDTSAFTNSDMSFTAFPTMSASVTCRTILSYIAEAAGAVARFDRDGVLRLKWYKELSPMHINVQDGDTLTFHQQSTELPVPSKVAYDDTTDSSTAYTKSVPSGATFGEVLQVGGKSVVWNQMSYRTAKTTTSKGITYTVDTSDASCTISGTATSASQIAWDAVQTAYVGHKYYISGCPSGGSSTKYMVRAYVGSTASGSGAQSQYDYGSGKICACQYVSTTYYYIRLNIRVASGCTVDNLVFKPRFYDLTLMFGQGSEPTSVDDERIKFIETYAEAHPEYNAGSVVSTEVDKVVVESANLWDEEWEKGVWNTSGQKAPSAENIRCKNYISVKPNSTYYISYGGSGNIVGMCFLSASKALISRNGNLPINAMFTTPSGCFYIAFNMASQYGTTYNHDIAIIKGTSGSYTPYHSPVEVAIPNSIKSLTGYGWGINDEVRNYVDFENMRYVRMISEVHIDSDGQLAYTQLENPVIHDISGLDWQFPIKAGSVALNGYEKAEYTVPQCTRLMAKLADGTIHYEGSGSNTYTILANSFIGSDSSRFTNVYNKLASVAAYNPIIAEILNADPSVEVGDLVTVLGGIIPLMTQRITWNNQTRAEYSANGYSERAIPDSLDRFDYAVAYNGNLSEKIQFSLKQDFAGMESKITATKATAEEASQLAAANSMALNLYKENSASAIETAQSITGHIRHGVLGYDGDNDPILGIAIGETVTEDSDGTIVKQNLATITADGLTLYVGAANQEVARFTNKDALVNGDLMIGGKWKWFVEPDGSLAHKYIGG